MATKRKTTTNQDLEAKIKDLEAKLSALASQLEPKAAEKESEEPAVETAPKVEEPAAEVATPEPEPAAAEAPKPKGTLPKGFEPPAPEPVPEKEEATQPPATVQEALEDAYRNAPTTDFHQYRTNVTGYSPAPNRYFVRLTAPVGTVPTEDWNRQKVAVTGYTQPSNQYFATRPRLAYHPPDKTFGSFSGVPLTVEGAVAQTQQTSQQQQQTAQEVAQTQQTSQQQQQPSEDNRSRKEKLDNYEQEYLQRLEQERIDAEKAYQQQLADEAKAQAQTQQTRGTLPKGFKPKVEEPKASRGTLPKGF